MRLSTKLCYHNAHHWTSGKRCEIVSIGHSEDLDFVKTALPAPVLNKHDFLVIIGGFLYVC
jgi:hypothetical protein